MPIKALRQRLAYALGTLLLCAPNALMADWQLANIGTTARIDVESGPQEFEIGIKNVGDRSSPAQDLVSRTEAPGAAFVSVLPSYEIKLIAGACGPWRDSNDGPAPFSVPFLPSIATGVDFGCPA